MICRLRLLALQAVTLPPPSGGSAPRLLRSRWCGWSVIIRVIWEVFFSLPGCEPLGKLSRRSRFHSVGGVEVTDKVWRADEVMGWIPIKVFIKAGPFDVVLELVVDLLDSQELFNLPFILTINNHWFGLGRVLSREGVCGRSAELVRGEYGVNSH